MHTQNCAGCLSVVLDKHMKSILRLTSQHVDYETSSFPFWYSFSVALWLSKSVFFLVSNIWFVISLFLRHPVVCRAVHLSFSCCNVHIRLRVLFGQRFLSQIVGCWRNRYKQSFCTFSVERQCFSRDFLFSFIIRKFRKEREVTQTKEKQTNREKRSSVVALLSH